MNKNKEHKLVPKLRFPEFVKEGNWKIDNLGNLADIKGRIGYRGYTTADIVEKGKGAITLSPSNFNENGKLEFDKCSYVSWDKYEESPEIMLENGQTVLVKTASVGKSAFVENLPEKTTINPQIVVLKPIKIEARFLAYTIFHNYVQAQIKNSVGAGAIPNMSQESISKFQIVLPPNENQKEQQKIAACLSSLDEVITAESQKLEVLKEHKKGLLQNLLPQTGESVPKFRFREFEDSGEWLERCLEEVADVITGNTPTTSERDYYGGDKMLVSPADINDNRFVVEAKTTLSELGFLKTRKIRANSVLFVCIGSTIGKVAQNKFECATNQQINSLVPFKEFSSSFLYSLLEANSQKIASLAGKQAVPLINKTTFSLIKLSFPADLAEQEKIADTLSSLDDLIIAQNQKIEALQHHKKGLLQGLFPQMAEVGPKRLADDRMEQKAGNKFLQSSHPKNPNSNK